MENYLEILINVLEKTSILMTIFIFYWGLHFYKKTKIYKEVIAGVLISGMTILIMQTPWQISEGIQLDTRTIYLLVSGLYFGPIATIMAAVSSIAFRIIIGGPGVIGGCLNIVFAAAVGIVWPLIRDKFKRINIHLELYLISLIAHSFPLLTALLIPDQGLMVLKIIWPFVIIVFPLIALFITVSLHYFKKQYTQQDLISRQQKILEYTINAVKDVEVFSLNKNFEYLYFNNFHKIQMKNFYDIEIKEEDNYLDYIVYPKMRERIKNNVLKAIEGKDTRTVIEVEVTPGKFLEETYLPMFDSSGELIGVSVNSEDITDRIDYQNEILELSYKDTLTQTFNRRYYSEQLVNLNNTKNLPLTIIFADINGLKLVNDAFGHEAGDKLLTFVAKKLTQTFSKFGSVMRIGGDEFAIILPNMGKKQANKLVEKVQKNILTSMLDGVNVSVSFGLDTKTAYENINTIVKNAEDNMYTNKLYERNSHRHNFIQTILKTLQERNPEEKDHSKRVGDICVLIGEQLQMERADLKLLEVISQLHDVGKIAISNRILQKPGKLTEKEWTEIKRHPEIGYRILLTSPSYAGIAEDILSHHERYDGKGYPRGLKGEEIPPKARIIAVADAYDAMTSNRPYRKAFTHEQAVKEIIDNKGTQFDPEVVEAFLKVANDLPKKV